MSYDDNSRRAGYGQGEGDYGRGQSGGYERTGGEADEYYNDGERPGLMVVGRGMGKAILDEKVVEDTRVTTVPGVMVLEGTTTI